MKFSVSIAVLALSCSMTCFSQETSPQEQSPADYQASTSQPDVAPTKAMAYAIPSSPGFVQTEFLWWMATQQASDFVLSNGFIPGATNPNVLGFSMGKFTSATFNWAPGIRLTSGYTTSRDSWTVAADYTYFHSHNTTQVFRRTDKPNYFSFATFIDITGTPLQSAKSLIHLNYNFCELLLQRQFAASPYIHFDFATGLSGAWINESWIIHYLAEQQMHLSNRWSYHAGGFVSKIKSHWNLGSHFQLINEIHGGLFLGSYLNFTKAYGLLPLNTYFSTTLYNPLQDTRGQDYPILPMLRVLLGFDWNHPCQSSGGIFHVGASFEATTWFGLHRVYKDVTGAGALASNRPSVQASSNVSLYGLSILAGYEF